MVSLCQDVDSSSNCSAASSRFDGYKLATAELLKRDCSQYQERHPLPMVIVQAIRDQFPSMKEEKEDE